MKEFKIGEDVYALNNHPDKCCQPRIKGKIYRILDILYCSKCGIQMINICGIVTQSNVSDKLIYKCGYECHSNLWWTQSQFFARPSELQYEIDKAVQEEDYEFAALLFKLQNESMDIMIKNE